MDKPEAIYRAVDFPHEVLLVKEVAFKYGVLYGILCTPAWLAQGWNPTPSNMFEDEQKYGVSLTPDELDALCTWWLSKRKKEAVPHGDR